MWNHLQLVDKLSNSAYKIEVKDGLTDHECKELFAKVLGEPISALPCEAIDVQRLCKHNPFVISVIASNLKQYRSNLTRWKYWKDALESNQSTSFEPLRKPIEESLVDLKNHDRQLYDYFKELRIFTDNVNIPVKVNVFVFFFFTFLRFAEIKVRSSILTLFFCIS